MNPVLTFKTPLWKEVVGLFSGCVFIGFGAFLAYISYIDGSFFGYVIGLPSVLFGLGMSVLSLSSNTVLRLNAEGVFVQPHIFSKRTIPWGNIDRFDKSVQSLEVMGS